MLIKQIFELRGPGPLGLVCTPITGCFYDKTIISKENIRLDCYLLLKYCRRQCTLLPLPGPNRIQSQFNLQSHTITYNRIQSHTITITIPKCKMLNVFWT